MKVAFLDVLTGREVTTKGTAISTDWNYFDLVKRHQILEPLDHLDVFLLIWITQLFLFKRLEMEFLFTFQGVYFGSQANLGIKLTHLTLIATNLPKQITRVTLPNNTILNK